MGKAGRRKKNRQKRKQQLNGDPIHATGDSDTSSNIIVNPQSAVQRLRHADPKVRHASLVALQASVLSQARCASHKPVSMKVLQAVREQVTSNDLECSAVASDCLAQYLISISSHKKNANNSDQQKQIMASWALVLLGRLDDCRKALEQQRQEQQSSKETKSKNQQKKAEKTKKRWYAVAAPCFIALCQLIEDNGHALDQINLQKKTFVHVVFGMLSLECDKKAMEAAADDMAMKDAIDEDAAGQQDAIFAKLRETTALYSARCLHSALDDNLELAEALDGGEQNQQIWINLLGIKSDGINNEHFLSVMTRLHLIGCLGNLYQLSLHGDSQGSNSVSWFEKAILEFGIRTSSPANSEGLLLEVLLSSKSDQNSSVSLLQLRLKEMEARYRIAEALLEKQQRDQQLEEEIDAMVKERKEPAKLIARRQKKVKEAKREAFREQQKAKMIAEAESSKDDDMMDASDNEEDEKEPAKEKAGKMVREQDGEEAKSEAMLEWIGTTGPIQLGLEIFTNLVSTWVVDGDDPMGGVGGGNTKSSTLARSIQGEKMAPRLARTLQTLSQFLRTIQLQKLPPDDPIRSDAEETIGKVSACVANCFLSGISDPLDTLWESALVEVRTELGMPSPSRVVLDACSSILAVAVEMDPGILRSSCSSSSRSDQIQLFQRLLPRSDAVCLISAVVLLETADIAKVSAETEATIRALTETFLALLRPSSQSVDPTTQTSILKAFMDWYGNDDFYPHLYESLGISQVISGALDFIAKNQSNLDLDEEQLQILHNSGRFLDYKQQFKQQLQSR